MGRPYSDSGHVGNGTAWHAVCTTCMHDSLHAVCTECRVCRDDGNKHLGAITTLESIIFWDFCVSRLNGFQGFPRDQEGRLSGVSPVP